MARFSAHGGVRFQFNGDMTSFGCELKDPFRFKLGSDHGNKRFLLESPRINTGVRPSGVTRVFSHGKKSSGFKSEEKFKRNAVDSEEEEDDETEFNDLSCFRGLVLDISYRLEFFCLCTQDVCCNA